MKTACFMLSLWCMASVAAAQSVKDSADIYYQHLDLNEVVVSSPAGQMKRRQAAAPISVVTQHTLRQTASTNIVDAIARQPGVAQVTTGNGISKPVIRGLGYNRIVSVMDGVRQEGQQWGDEHGLELDAHGVSQVEILKGPASLMYGSDALAGVVIFHPDNIEPEGQTAASLSAGYQTNSGMVDYSLRLGGNRRGFVWNARYSEKFAHAFKTPYDGHIPGTQLHERAAGALLGLNRSWGFSHLTLRYYHLTPSMAEGGRDAATGVLLAPDGWSPKSYRKTLPYQQIRHLKVVWDNSIALGDGVLKAIVGYQLNLRQEYEDGHHHHHAEAGHEDEEEEHEDEEGEHEDEEGEHAHEEESGEAAGGEEHHDEESEAGDHPSLDFRLHTLTYDARYVYSGFGGWTLAGGAGGMYQRSQNHGEEFLIPAYNLFDVGVYATASRSLGRWTLSGGLRFDHRHLHSHGLYSEGAWRFSDFTRRFDALTGSVGAVWHATRQLNLRANVARGFRAPNLSELGSNGVHHGSVRYELGNRDLRAEHSWQADLGIDYTGTLFTVEAALFLNRIGNYIFAQRQGTTLQEGYLTYAYAQGDALLKGFEAGVDVHPIHQLHVGSTFSMVDARQLHQPEQTRWLPLTPAPRLTGEVKWEFLHNDDDHSPAPHQPGKGRRRGGIRNVLNNTFVSVGVEHTFRQSHYYMLDDTETPTPAYTLLSATLGTDILIGGGRKLCEVYVIGENLLNTAYQSHLSRLKYTDVNSATGRRGILNPGRNVALKVVFPVSWQGRPARPRR